MSSSLEGTLKTKLQELLTKAGFDLDRDALAQEISQIAATYSGLVHQMMLNGEVSPAEQAHLSAQIANLQAAASVLTWSAIRGAIMDATNFAVASVLVGLR